MSIIVGSQVYIKDNIDITNRIAGKPGPNKRKYIEEHLPRIVTYINLKNRIPYAKLDHKHYFALEDLRSANSPYKDININPQLFNPNNLWGEND